MLPYDLIFWLFTREEGDEQVYVDLDDDPLPQNDDPFRRLRQEDPLPHNDDLFRRLREEDPAWYKVEQNKDGSKKIIIKHSILPGQYRRPMSEAEGRTDITGECEGLYMRQEDKDIPS